MTAEGDSGLLFSTVLWSDGASEDVGSDNLAGLDQIFLQSGSANVATVAPHSSDNSENFWKLGVEVAASRECVSTVLANWSMCGTILASARVPVFLDLPNPAHAEFLASCRAA